MVIENKSIKTRNETSSDKNFLLALYADTRNEELKHSFLNEESKKLFIQSQFELQYKHYHGVYTNVSFQIILFKKKKIGRIYVSRNTDEIRLVDISILSSYRNRGIGKGFLNGLIKEAKLKNIPVTLHVLDYIPAYKLYKKMGFIEVSKETDRVFMKYNP